MQWWRLLDIWKRKEGASVDIFHLRKTEMNFHTDHRRDEFEASVQVITGKEQDSPEASTAREENTNTIDLTSTAGASAVVPPTATPAAATLRPLLHARSVEFTSIVAYTES